VNTVYAKGCDIDSQDKSGFELACFTAQNAYATVIVVGIDQREGLDRTSLDLPGVQNQLISIVSSCSKGPVVVVVMAGGPLDLSVLKLNPNVASILWVGYPGQSGGDAIAQTPIPVILQILPVFQCLTCPCVLMQQQEIQDALTGFILVNLDTLLDMDCLTPSSPLFGCLQRTFGCPWKSKTLAETTVIVHNNGKRTGDVVVLAFVVPPNAGKDGVPLKSLYGFIRLHDMPPNSEKTVSFPITAHDLSMVDSNGKRTVVPGVWTAMVGDIERPIFVL